MQETSVVLHHYLTTININCFYPVVNFQVCNDLFFHELLVKYAIELFFQSVSS